MNDAERPRELRIERLTSVEIAEAVAAGARTAILPLGAIEQHGPHLPLSVDSDHADALAFRIAQELGDALVLPTVRVGYSPHHLGFAGTLSVRSSTLEAICLDYCSSLAAHGFTRVVLFSGHIGNYPVMREFEPRLTAALAPSLQVIVYRDGAAILNAWRESAQSVAGLGSHVGGHADVMLGYIAANESHKTRLEQTHGNMGLYASGDDCWLGLRGLRTLPVRLARHQETGLKLARWLAGRAEVARVLHPGLESDPGHTLWKRDYTGACGLFGLVLRPVPERAVAAFVDGLRHFGLGWSWGGFESLIVPSHILRTARPFWPEGGPAKGPVLRIHAGLEDADDLIADLEEGLERLKRAA